MAQRTKRSSSAPSTANVSDNGYGAANDGLTEGARPSSHGDRKPNRGERSSQTSHPTAMLVRTGSLPLRRRNDDRAPTPAVRLAHTLTRAASDELPAVSALGLKAALETMAPASMLAAAADLDCWLDWCDAESRRAFPADPEDLVRYLRALGTDGKKPATLARRIASLATTHRLLGFDDNTLPTSTAMVRNALRANRRQGAAQRQAAPLRFGGEPAGVGGFTIAAMLDACASDPQGLRDAALLSVSYDAGLRVSELIAVVVDDVRPQPDGSGLLFLPRSKTDQEQLGAWASLSADTMRRLKSWRSEADVSEGPLFRRVGVDRRRAKANAAAEARWPEDAATVGRAKAGELVTYTIGERPLTRQGVTGIYRRIALSAAEQGLVDVPPDELDRAVKALSTHSLRVGLAQDLFAAGEDGAEIALTLRWSSPSTALRYGRQLQAGAALPRGCSAVSGADNADS